MRDFYRVTRSSELKHHGIEGQKWGVRNGPPYPLDRETHTKVVREGYKRDRELLKQGKLSKKKVSGTSHMTNRWEQQWQEVFYASNLDTPDKISTMSEELAKGVDWWDNSAKNGKHFVTDNDILNVNPGGNTEPGQANNCTKCTAALEMRRRGILATAGRSFCGQRDTAMQYWFDGAVSYKEKGIDNFSERVEKVIGNNGSAALGFKYPNGNGGHSLYAYFDEDGRFTVADGQTQQKYRDKEHSSRKEQIATVMSWLKDDYGFDTENAFSTVMRLDTATPNYEHMAEDSVIRTRYTNHSMNQIRNKNTKKFATGLYEYRDDNGVKNFGFDYVNSNRFQDGTYTGPTHYYYNTKRR